LLSGPFFSSVFYLFDLAVNFFLQIMLLLGNFDVEKVNADALGIFGW
jgi:hypothetical protein